MSLLGVICHHVMAYKCSIHHQKSEGKCVCWELSEITIILWVFCGTIHPATSLSRVDGPFYFWLSTIPSTLTRTKTLIKLWSLNWSFNLFFRDACTGIVLFFNIITTCTSTDIYDGHMSYGYLLHLSDCSYLRLEVWGVPCTD